MVWDSCWDHVRCDDQGQIAGIGLSLSNAKGTLPSAFASISTLRVFSLILAAGELNAGISGTIPAAFRTDQLWILQMMAIFGQPSLSGTFPTELLSVGTRRKALINIAEPISGTLPPQPLQTLIWVHAGRSPVNGTKAPTVSGSIPAAWGDSKAHVVFMHQNMISGSILKSESGMLPETLISIDIVECSPMSGSMPAISSTALLQLYVSCRMVDEMKGILGEPLNKDCMQP